MRKIIVFGFLSLIFNVRTSGQDNAKVVFYDEFDDNKNEWWEGDSESRTAKIDKGFYSIKAIDGNKWFYTKVDFDYEKENFRCEVKFVSSDKTGKSYYGMVYGMYSSLENYGEFEIYEGDGGQVLINHYYNDKSHKLMDWVKEPVNSKENILVVERKGNIVYHYLNNKLVGTQTSYNYFGNRFGFIIGKEHEVKVDYIKVTTWPKKINILPDAIVEGSLKPLPGEINTKYSERYPVISPDGKKIFMARQRDPEIEGDGTDIYYSTVDENGNWSKPIPMGKPLNNSGSNFVVSISPDNNRMLVANTYNEKGEVDGSGISLTLKTPFGWSIPRKQEIKNLVNNSDYVAYFLTAGNKVMLTAIENDNSLGEKDIFVSFIESDGSWSEPKNIGNIVNTVADEFNPFVAADGKTMYFCSYGHEGYGSADIFVTTRLDETWLKWSEPLNLGPVVNSDRWDGSFSIPANGDKAIIVSTNNSIEGSEDLFSVDLNKARPDFVILLSGRTLHSGTKEPISSSVRYVDLNTGKEIGNGISDPVTGEFKVILPAGSQYGIYADKDEFYPVSENVSTEGIEKYQELNKDLYLSPISKGEVIKLNNLFFDFDKATIKQESFNELERLVSFLNKNKSIKIEITGHTDDKGNDAYNLQLSSSRANAVTTYLIEKGIDASRLKSKGYGESKPVTSNETEEGRAMNRRVEFVILEK